MPLTPITWGSLTNATVDGDGNLEKTGGADICSGTITGNAGGRSTKTLTAGDWKFECTLGPAPGDSGRTYVGLDDGALSLDYTTWQFCFYVNTAAQSPYPANTVRIYEAGTLKTYIEGEWVAGDLLQIIAINGVIRYYLNSRLLYTSTATPTYPMRAVASIACPNTTVMDAQFVTGLDIAPKSGCPTDNVSSACGSVKVDVNNPISTMVYNNYPSTYPLSYALWVQMYDEVPASHADDLGPIISNHGGGRFLLFVQRQGDGSGRLMFGGGDPQGSVPFIEGPNLTIGTWYHVAITGAAGSPGTRTLYVNGEAVGASVGVDYFFSFMYIGNDEGLRPIPARMTRFHVWDKELTAEEVLADYADCYEPEAVPGNVYSWSKLNGKGDSFTDQTGNGRSITAAFISGSSAMPDTLAACAECAPDPAGGTACASEVGDDVGTGCTASWTIPTPAAFPTSPRPLYFDELETDWGEHGQKFPDGNPEFNTIQTAKIRRFVVEWGGLTRAEALALDAHYASTRGGLSFTLVHPHTGESITGVRYESYDRSPHVRVWAQSRSAKLVKFTS